MRLGTFGMIIPLNSLAMVVDIPLRDQEQLQDGNCLAFRQWGLAEPRGHTQDIIYWDLQFNSNSSC